MTIVRNISKGHVDNLFDLGVIKKTGGGGRGGGGRILPWKIRLKNDAKNHLEIICIFFLSHTFGFLD